MERFIARQPVFDRRLRVFGYELLFRESLLNAFPAVSGDHASAHVISDTCFLFDLATYAGGKKAFINVTSEVLRKGYVTILPKDLAVVEILESVEPTSEIIAACGELKQAGYLLALDDFRDLPCWKPLLPLCDMIKVDFLATNRVERARLAKQYGSMGIRLLAEKVETPADFAQATQLGYDLFQGYFFKTPAVVHTRDIPAQRLHYLQLLSEIHRPNTEITKLAEIIKGDVSLTYKLLRYINSAFFGVPNRVQSVKHALLLMGMRELRKWAALMTLTCMAEDRPGELLTSALLRARFCESLAQPAGQVDRAQCLFLLGLLSLIDVIAERPMSEIVASLPIDEDLKGALLGQPNPLRTVLDCVAAYETGDWERVSAETRTLSLVESSMPLHYEHALKWTQERLSEMQLAA